MATIGEIGKTIKRQDGQRATKNAPSIVDGLVAEPVPAVEGVVWLTPAQLLSLEVPVVARDNGGFAGFQREKITAHARKIAEAMREGAPFPPISISLLEDGRLVTNDGQHRGLGGVIAGVPVRAVIERRTEEEARQLFALQGKGRRVNANTLVLAGRDPFSLYVQEACVDPRHPWAGIVGETSTPTRISAGQMREAIAKYCGARLGTMHEVDPGSFSRELCDELAALFGAFGTKKTNPAAFDVLAVRAITDAAVLIVRRGGGRANFDRWMLRMPKFPFMSYRSYRKSREVADLLVAHFNVRLGDARKVSRG